MNKGASELEECASNLQEGSSDGKDLDSEVRRRLLC